MSKENDVEMSEVLNGLMVDSSPTDRNRHQVSLGETLKNGFQFDGIGEECEKCAKLSLYQVVLFLIPFASYFANMTALIEMYSWLSAGDAYEFERGPISCFYSILYIFAFLGLLECTSFWFYWSSKTKMSSMSLHEQNDVAEKVENRKAIKDGLSIVTSTIFVVEVILKLTISFKGYCYAPKTPGSAELFDVVTPTHRILIFPAIMCLILAVMFAYDHYAFAPKPGSRSLRRLYKVYGVLRVIIITATYALAVISFMLIGHGSCLLSLFNMNCQGVGLVMTVQSQTHLVVESSIRTLYGPNTLPTTVTVDFLRHLQADEMGKLKSGHSPIVHMSNSSYLFTDDGFNLDEFYNSLATFVSISDPHVKQLSSDSGVLVLFPCNSVSPFFNVGPRVDCFKRVKVRFGGKTLLDLGYNTDYIYRLNESTELQSHWRVMSSRFDVNMIFSGINNVIMKVFQDSFRSVDPELSKMLINFNVPVTVDGVQILWVKCNNTCFCYKCSNPKNPLPPNCHENCRHVSQSVFKQAEKTFFCPSAADWNDKRCQPELIPVAQAATVLNISESNLYSYQQPMNISAYFKGRKIRKVVMYDPDMPMPNPEASFESEDLSNCTTANVATWILLICGLIAFLFMVIFLFCGRKCCWHV